MKHNRTRIFLMLALASTSSLFSQIVTSPPAPRSSPTFKYITARIHEKPRPGGQETHVWVVSPLQWSRFKKNGSITEMQFLLIGERDWNPIGIDINKIDRIEYELSTQPEACVLPVPTQSTTQAPLLSDTWTAHDPSRNWSHGGYKIIQIGKDLTFFVWSGERHTGHVLSENSISYVEANVTGKVSRDGKRIDWSNGTYWVKDSK